MNRQPVVQRQAADTLVPRTAYTVEEAAQSLGCSRAHLYRAIAAGSLVSIKIGRLRRIPVQALEAFLATPLEESAWSRE